MQNLALLNKSEIFVESFDVLRLAHSEKSADEIYILWYHV